MGISIGVAIYPESSDDVVKLIEKADQALYKAKEKGKNQIYGWWQINNEDSSFV